MNKYRNFFKDKKVTVMGLGLLGRGVGDTAFLAKYCKEVTITDLKDKRELKKSLDKLRRFKNIKYVLGKHKLENFRNVDMILKSAGVPLDSKYIKEAKKNDIPVEMSAPLFAKLSGLPIVGVTGTRGKSTVTGLIAHILKAVGKKVLLGGNVRGVSNLQLLSKIKSVDFAVLELDSWQLQGFGEAKISPHIAVFTNFMDDHLNYYGSAKLTPSQARKRYFADKANIFKFQQKDDLLILGPKMKLTQKVKSKIIRAKTSSIRGWKFKLLGAHNLENIACAVAVSRAIGVSDRMIKKAVASFRGLPGRLEFVKRVKGVDIYNDNNSTTPDATIAALRAFGQNKNVVLIMGGENKELDMSHLLAEIPKFCSKIVLFKEKGTNIVRDQVFKFEKAGIDVYEEKGLSNTVKKAFRVSRPGDTILYSPAFSSFGRYFQNEYDRGDQFIKLVKTLGEK